MGEGNKRKPTIMLHYVSPNKVGGPNVSNERIKNSELNIKYNFENLVQEKPAGGKLNLKLINALRKEIRRVKPDILHLSGLQSSAFHAVIAAKLARCNRILITIRGFSGDDMKIPAYKRWIFNKIIEPITLMLADGVLGNSNYTANREIVKKYAKNRLGYIYNFPPESKNENNTSIRKELGLHENDIVCVTVGRVVIDKGFRELGLAINQLSTIPDLKFVIIGEGEYLVSFKKIVEDHMKSGKVYTLGTRKDVQGILSECDIFVLPTLHETLSNATLEASVAGLGIIVSNTGGLPEIIQDGINGLLISPGSSEELIEAIKKLYCDSELRKNFALKAQNVIEKKFSTSNICNKLDSVYEKMIND